MPSEFRAARPIVWISERSERRNPSLSASSIATSETSGRSSPSRKKVDADQHVKLATPQIAKYLDAFERHDIAVQIADLDADLGKILAQILRHPLCQRRDQNALVSLGTQAAFFQQVVDLALDRPDLDDRIEQARSDE